MASRKHCVGRGSSLVMSALACDRSEVDDYVDGWAKRIRFSGSCRRPDPFAAAASRSDTAPRGPKLGWGD